MLVVVTSPERAEETVEYAVRKRRDSRAELGASVALEAWIVLAPEAPPVDPRTRARLEDALQSREGGADHDLHVLRLESGDALDRTDSLLEHLASPAVSRLVISGDVDVSIAGLRDRLGVEAVEIAPVEPPPERRRLLHPGGVRRTLAVFGVTYLFYLAIGGFAGGLDLLTGAISAGVVSVSLARVAFREEPTLSRTGARLARTVAFVPVLLWEVTKANVVIAAIILHPGLPIEPSIGVLETDAREDLERVVLANSITLTPGTLAVDVRGREFVVHSLTAGSREDLEGDRLERLVAWVFHGGNRPVRPVESREGEG